MMEATAGTERTRSGVNCAGRTTQKGDPLRRLIWLVTKTSKLGYLFGANQESVGLNQQILVVGLTY